MACQVIRDSKNEIQQVLAPNGKESKLFNDIQGLTNNKEEALKLWAQVYTPQFKEWFGDWETGRNNPSNVIDSNGEPLLVYHGSDAYGFSSFSKGLLGSNTRAASARLGFFFASNKSASRKYLANKIYSDLQESIDRNYRFKDDSGYSEIDEMAELQWLAIEERDFKELQDTELFEDITKLSIAEKAFDLGDINEEELNKVREEVRSKYQINTNIAKIGNKLITNHFDSVVEEWPKDDYGRPVNPLTNIHVDASGINDLRRGVLETLRQRHGLNYVKKIKQEESNALDDLIYSTFINLKNPLVYDYKGAKKRIESYTKIINQAIGEGRDGVIIRNTFDPEATDLYIPFESYQIKSLFNQGNFSAASDSIYHQIGDGSPFEPAGKIQTIAQKLYNKFNIPYKIVNNPNTLAKGWFNGDGVTLNIAMATGDTPFHEYLHPFILILEKQNPKLYNDLIGQLTNDFEGIRVVGEINRNNNYSKLTEKQKLQEALVHYLGLLTEKKYNKAQSPFNRFISWLKSLFKKIQIDFKDLRLDMKLSELADIIVDDLYVADLRSALIDANVLVRYQKPDTELTYATVYDRIKDKIAILNATIRNRKKGDQFREDINTLNEIIKNEDEVTSINNFVSNSIHYIDAAQKRFETLRNSVKNAGQLSKDELAYNLNILGEIQQLLNVYNSLDDVLLLLDEDENEAENSNMVALSKAIRQKNKIIADFKSFSLTYLTEWLYPYLEPTNKNLEAQGKKHLILTKEKFREQLVTALRDISAAGYWFGATINSRDPISAAVGLALKDVVYENHVKDLAIKKELTHEYDATRGTALYKSSRDEESFNMEFLREVDSWEKVGVDPDTGEDKYDYVKRLAFYQEYQMDQYEKAKRELYNRIGPRPIDPLALKSWKKAQSEWYINNARVNPEAEQIIAEKKRTLTKRQYEEWILTNTKEVDELDYGYGRKTSDYYGNRVLRGSYNRQSDTFRVYSGELILPAEKYKDRKFPVLMRNPYYRKLYSTYKTANDQLGTYGLKYGIIPQLSKGANAFSDLSWGNGIKGNIKKLKDKALNSITADFDENRTVQRQDGSEVKKIPIYYTRMLNTADLKLDLLEGVLKYSQMSNNYYTMAEIEPNIIVLKTVLNGDFNLGIKGRDVAKTNSKGIQVFNAITKKIVPKMAREDMLNNRLNEFINDVVYGDSEFEQAVNIAGREISLNKISNKVALLTALQNMAGNVNGGISNVVVGNFNNSIEAIGRRFYTMKDWGWAQGVYAKELPKLVAEVAGQGESFLNRLADHYDVPQGEFKDHYGQNVSKGEFNKLMKTSTLFFLQKGGEHQIQITGLLSLMHATKVTDARTGEQVSLYTAMKETGGDTEQMLYRYNWTIQDDKAFRNRLHALVKNLQGVYNSFDKAMLSRRWYGKLAIMFRKYLFRAFTSRYGTKYIDYELGDEEGGYWREFASKLITDVKEYKWGAIQRMWSKEGYNDFQKSALNKTVYELGVIIATFVLIGIASGDDDKDWLDAEMALQLTRFSADITQYINPSDFIRVIRNPAASINMLEKWISWFTQLFHPFEEYQRASGFAKAGDNKLKIKTLKLIPVVRQWINLLTPKEQIKFYNLTGR